MTRVFQNQRREYEDEMETLDKRLLKIARNSIEIHAANKREH